MMTAPDGSSWTRTVLWCRNRHLLGRAGAVALTVLIGVASSAAFLLPTKRHAPAPVVMRVSGQIGGHQSDLVALLTGSSAPTMLIVLDSNVVTTCEDLARQLREALHVSSASRRRNIVVAPGSDSAFLRVWMAVERIGPISTIASSDGLLLVGGKAVAAPAVLLVDRMQHVSAGIAHLSRVPNTRASSFASELRLR